MKKIFCTGVLLVAVQLTGFAQWTPTGATGSSTIYNTNTTGSVGIGISSPTVPYQKLHVDGSIHISLENSIGFNQADNFSYNGRNIGHYSLGWYTEAGAAVANLSGSAGIRFFTNAAERMFVTSNGNVGIGTPTPLGRLDINPGGWNNIPKISFNQVDDNPSIRLYRPTGSIVGGNLTSWVWWIENDAFGTLSFKTGGHALAGSESVAAKISFDRNGNVGINTSDTKGYKLGVNGSAIATSMTVKLNANWPDFVFAETYGLRSLSEVESYIKANAHLPEVPSAAQVGKDGINLGEMDATLLKKIEELTLYLIEQDKQLQELKKANEVLQKEVQVLKR
ncbi:hypothetical protein IC235_11555 [Hymenobacter sp. BT664]|uniref:BZIP transcription factor n=1 Tax=Hymenobacter montanus TaxID=2771359 RepID=A0A927BEC1_9BACT|nr:hypothetical protein [Hymenobacter montanus]MBD2768524.1 hypothetical protein [Hymenobacter montanus]